MENIEKINNEIFNNYLKNENIKELYYNYDYNFLFDHILNNINKYNIQLYNIEIINDLLYIRLNNLLINKDLKLNILENLIKELNNNYCISYYSFKDQLFIIEIEINFY